MRQPLLLLSLGFSVAMQWPTSLTVVQDDIRLADVVAVGGEDEDDMVEEEVYRFNNLIQVVLFLCFFFI